MTTAAQVSQQLRKLADSLDAQPDAIIPRPYVWFSADSKDEFLSIARLMPRPLTKREDSGEEKWKKIRVEYNTLEEIFISASVLKSLTCELVEPAKPAVYRCVPILSEDEIVDASSAQLDRSAL